MRTGESLSNTPGLRLVGEEESGSALINYGPLNPVSTIGHRIQSHQLEELHRCLERQVMTLESKYSEVLDTWITVSEHLVRLTSFFSSTDTTDMVE